MTGFIPTGWYPTAAQFSRDGSRIFVLSGKGLTSADQPARHPARHPGHGRAVQRRAAPGLALDRPDARRRRPPDDDQARSTASRRYDGRDDPGAGSAPVGSPIPQKVGGPSPIKHVFYIIRENRTYDQILGDLERATAIRTSACSARMSRPTRMRIAREFVMLDNFYVDAEVSYDGHAYSTGAYATDFVEKIWPTNYGSRGARYLSEGGGKMRNAYGNVTAPLNGYIWDACNPRRRQRAQLRRVRPARPRARGREGQRRGRGGGDGARPQGQRAPELHAVRPDDPRQQARGRLARGVQAVRAVRRAPAPEHHPARQRPHRRHPGRLPDAARDGRRERRRARPGRRGDQPRAGSGRNRRSSSSKTTPRPGRTTSTRTARPRSWSSPFIKRGAVDCTLYTTGGDAADDRADPRPAADEQPGRRARRRCTTPSRPRRC